MSGNWIAKAVPASSKGGLHRSLGVASDKTIPQAKIMKAEPADSPKVAKQARLAEVLEHMRKRCHGGFV